jgi:colicin import membrane protein
MHQAAAERSEFAPPPPGGHLRAFGLALLAHVLLILALTWGLHWKNQPQDLAVQAELWSPAPQHATAPPPRPPPPPTPRTETKPPPPPQPVAPIQNRDAEIALERKKKEQAERQAAAEQARLKQQAEKKAAEQAKRKEEEAARKAEAEKLAKAEAQKKEQAEQARKQAEADDAARRKAAVERARQLAGDDERDAGPSGDYAARIRAVVRPNIVFTDSAPGNPVAEVEVHTGPTGAIISRRITKSSGVKSWDEAVLRALDRTEKLPSDSGRYWNPMLISFKLRD